MLDVISESLARRSFKRSLGDVNHAYATWVVALANLPDKDAIIPDDLKLAWSPLNLSRSKNIAHDSAKRAVLSLVVSSFDGFIDDLITEPYLASHDFRTQLDGCKKSVGKRLGVCQQSLTDLDETSCLMDLLIFWRNRLIHESDSSLDKGVANKLRDHSDIISRDYEGCDIELALKHAKTRALPSNVEIIALILAAQRFVRRLDCKVLKELDVESYLNSLVANYLQKEGKSLAHVWSWQPARRESWIRQVSRQYSVVRQDATELAFHSGDFNAAISSLANLSVSEASKVLII